MLFVVQVVVVADHRAGLADHVLDPRDWLGGLHGRSERFRGVGQEVSPLLELGDPGCLLLSVWPEVWQRLESVERWNFIDLIDSLIWLIEWRFYGLRPVGI